MKESVNILICSTGSVASIKLPLLIETIIKDISPFYEVSVKYCLSEKAQHFVSTSEISQCEGFTDQDEWNYWKKRGDPVLHIDLSKWADILLIAPLDANTLAKMANGLCDNLVLCVVRAWELSKPLLFCPAMNTKMWTHPITASQITTLQRWGYTCVDPISKTLMCGDTGVGAMAEVTDIVRLLLDHIPRALNSPLHDQ